MPLFRVRFEGCNGEGQALVIARDSQEAEELARLRIVKRFDGYDVQDECVAAYSKGMYVSEVPLDSPKVIDYYDRDD